MGHKAAIIDRHLTLSSAGLSNSSQLTPISLASASIATTCGFWSAQVPIVRWFPVQINSGDAGLVHPDYVAEPSKLPLLNLWYYAVTFRLGVADFSETATVERSHLLDVIFNQAPKF